MSERKGNIAVIGEKDSVLGFKAVGFDVYEISDPQAAEETIHKLAKQRYGIIFITEQTLAPISKILDQYKDDKIPAIIPIPGKDGSLGIGLANVSSSVERAVGADILKEK